MLTSIRSRLRASVLYSFVFASITLLSACSGGSSGGNNNGGGSPGAPVIANTQPLAGTMNSAYGFTFTVSSGGQAPFTWSETGALPHGLMFASNGTLSGTPTASGSFPITVKVQDSASQTATKGVTIQINSVSAFTFTGSMATPRIFHTATLLSSGQVVVVGGKDNNGNAVATAETYEPATQTFTATASMSDSRAQHIATGIGLGAVLVAGGYRNDGLAVTTLASGQSYKGAFTPLLSDMIEPRAQTTITSLSGSGLFILTGGAKFVLTNCGNNCVTVVPQSLSTTEGFSSFDLDFFPEPSMNTARRGHTATLLADSSTILIVGGANSTLGARSELVDTVLSSAELFH